MLKRYYLMHLSYWLQQLFILVLKIEKPRKDYNVLAVHHLVTLWLIGFVRIPFSTLTARLMLRHSGSYATNFTLIGNAVFVSMDLPDAFFAVSPSLLSLLSSL